MWKTVLSSPVSELTGRLKNDSTFKHDIKINSVVKLSNFFRQEIYSQVSNKRAGLLREQAGSLLRNN